jgi:hypothetical protein
MKARPSTKIDLYQLVAIITASLVLVYTFLRAQRIAITYDEACTYLVHTRSSLGHILSFAGPFAPNNHLLNTLLVKITTHIFGKYVLAIRLPALLGHILYLAGVYNILKIFLERGRFLAGVALAVSSPFLLDLFSCGRGYSLGLGFSAAALFFIFKHLEGKDPAKRVLFVSLAVSMLTLSALSNAAFLVIFAGVCASLIAIELLTPSRIRDVGLALFITVCGALFLYIFYQPSVIARIVEGVSGYGGGTGFWTDTVYSLLACSLYGKHDATACLIMSTKFFILLSFVAAVVISILSLLKRIRIDTIDRYLIFMTLVIFFIVSFIKIQSLLFGAKYPIDRAAIYLIPLYIIFFLALWQRLASSVRGLGQRAIDAIFYIIIIAVVTHNISCLNLDYYYLWRNESPNLLSRLKLEN